MVEMMKEYHSNLQNNDNEVDWEKREAVMTQTLDNLDAAPSKENKVNFT